MNSSDQTILARKLISAATLGVKRSMMSDLEDIVWLELLPEVIIATESSEYVLQLQGVSTLARWGHANEMHIQILRHAASLDAEPEFQIVAAATLARAGDPAALEVLVSLSNEGMWGISPVALDTLCQIGHQDTIHMLRGEVHHEDAGIAVIAAASLARIGDGSGQAILLEFLRGGLPREQVRSLKALANLAGSEIESVIHEYCASADTQLRRTAYLCVALRAPAGSAAQQEALITSWSILSGFFGRICG